MPRRDFLDAWLRIFRNLKVSVESRPGAGADAKRRPVSQTPLIKPDVRISRIRLSDWLHRRLTNASPLALADAIRPKGHTPVPRGTGGCRATTPCDAFSENAAPCHTHADQPPGRL